MANPSISMGGEGTQRPPQAQQGPSALDAMKTSKPAPSPAAVKTIGSDQTKAFDAGGQIFAQGLSAGRVTEPGTNPSTGDDTNVQATPAGYPTGGKSRAPVTGSAPGPRTKNLNKLRGGK